MTERSRKVAKLKTNICSVCGKEYEMYKFTVYGGIAGVRTKYCSDECSMVARNERQKNRNRSKAALLEKKERQKTEPKQKINRQYNNMFKIGPMESMTCLGCPFLGWKCREMKHPICRPHHKMHHEYKRVIREMEDLYYLW